MTDIDITKLLENAFFNHFGVKLEKGTLHIKDIETRSQIANWELELNENWSGSKPEAAHWHAIFLHETAAALQMTHPKISFGESA